MRLMGTIRSTVLWIGQTFDLLDVVLLLAFSLITTGVYLLWGIGWACLILGILFLVLIFLGIPAASKS